MVSPNGNTTNASVTALSFVCRAGMPGADQRESDLDWTYARRAGG